MAYGLRIFRVFGIDVNLHWTFIAMLLLVFLLGSAVFFILFVLLFACVLIHELSHSITALRNRIKVREIVLLPIGGASVIDDIHIDPKVEFNISVVGPISSLVLGGVFGIFAALSPPGLATQILQYLFIINIFLGVSNLIPAFPMDGGRVMRSYLEERMDKFKATMLTVRISKYMMVLIVIAAIAYIAVQSYSIDYKAFDFMYTVIIVFFLYGGAQAEERSAVMRKRTERIKLMDMASKDYSLVKAGIGINGLYATIKRTKRQRIFTLIGGKYYYIDVSKIESVSKKKLPEIKDIAVPVPNIDYRTNVVDAFSKLEAGAGIAAVMKGKRMAGMVTAQGMKAFISLHIASK